MNKARLQIAREVYRSNPAFRRMVDVITVWMADLGFGVHDVIKAVELAADIVEGEK